MATPRTNYSPQMTERFVADGTFLNAPFCVADVGASGGIEQHWRVFGQYLRAVGFDPLVNECERLNRLEPSDDIRYHAAYVGACKESAPSTNTRAGPHKPSGYSKNNQPFPRTSAVRAIDLMKIDFVDRYNSFSDVLYSNESLCLDEYFLSHERRSNIDFLKIDTDGCDYDVLRGSENILSKCLVLGIFVESQFHGEIGSRSNLFSNIDRFLRERGFSLFDIEVYRYTRAVLPGRFTYNIPAQTTTGQVMWGDALYLRDLAAPQYERDWGGNFSPYKILKLASIFEIYGLSDCAAELLLHFRDRIGELVDVDECLDVLAREMDPSATSFVAYNEKFESFPESFLSDHASIGDSKEIRSDGKSWYDKIRERFAKS